jgi:hypothetical protein
MKRNLFLVIAWVALLSGCGSDDKSNTPAVKPPSGAVWSAADEQEFLGHCGFGEKVCPCLMKALKASGNTYQQYKADPATLGQKATGTPTFKSCIGA